jgi:hypothetical protein
LIAKTTAKNWFTFYLCPTINLLYGFVESTENQIKGNIKHFEENKTGTVIDYGHPISEQYVTEYNGLTSDEWDLYGVFSEYYPNLHRRSAFLTLVGIFEHELNKLCEHCREQFNLNEPVPAFGGLERATKYLKQHADIVTHKNTLPWCDIKKIQVLRNAFAHQDGRAFGKNGDISSIFQHVKENKFLSIDERKEVIIHEGYLDYVRETYFQYFELLNNSIQERLGHA